MDIYGQLVSIIRLSARKKCSARFPPRLIHHAPAAGLKMDTTTNLNYYFFEFLTIDAFILQKMFLKVSFKVCLLISNAFWQLL